MDTPRESFDRAIHLLKGHAGYRQHPYRDARGILTIGYGRNLEAKGVSLKEAYWMLMEDIGDAEAQLASLTCWSGLSPVRQAALIDLTVNPGFAGVLEFKRMLARIDLGDWSGAAAELRDSLAEKQEPHRVADLCAMLIAG